MSGGFDVNIATLRKYSGTLAENKSSVGEVDGLVGKADVGDESWGVVGLFVKQQYTDMLNDLTDLLKDMQEGLQSASDKMKGAADTYQQTEDDHKKTWDQLTGKVEDSGVQA